MPDRTPPSAPDSAPGTPDQVSPPTPGYSDQNGTPGGTPAEHVFVPGNYKCIRCHRDRMSDPCIARDSEAERALAIMTPASRRLLRAIAEATSAGRRFFLYGAARRQAYHRLPAQVWHPAPFDSALAEATDLGLRIVALESFRC